MPLNYKFTRRQAGNVLFAIIIAILLFVPAAKALVIRGLMSAGFFQPTVEVPSKEVAVIRSDLSGIRVKDIHGNVTDLGNLKGKVIFLNFWATWCPPCQAEMPSINKLYSQFKDNKNIVFIMVDADSELVKATGYMKRKKFELPVHALTSTIPDQLFSGSLPTTILFDKEGHISFQKEGAADYMDGKFVAFVKKLTEQ